MPTATRTILFTDLAEYTDRVARADRESLHRILEGHRAVVEPIVAAKGRYYRQEPWRFIHVLAWLGYRRGQGRP